MQVSSVHMTFNAAAEGTCAAAAGWKRRVGLQYHWNNRAFADFEDYLAALKQKRRKGVRQERKAISQQGLSVMRLKGSAVTPAIWERFYEFYLDTCGACPGRLRADGVGLSVSDLASEPQP